MALKKGDKYKVDTKKDPLHLRKTPNGSVITHIPKGSKVSIANVSKCTSEWLYVTYNSKTGYAYKKYLSKVTTKSKTSNSTSKSKSSSTGSNSGSKKDSSSTATTVVVNKKVTNIQYAGKNVKIAKPTSVNDIINYKEQMMASGLYSREQLVDRRYDKYFRYGHIDPYYNIANTREYIFFTKPNLNIMSTTHNALKGELKEYPFFQEMYNRYRPVLSQLQHHKNDTSFLSPLLSYHVDSNLDMPSITAKDIDGPETIYGIGVNYRGEGRTSDFNNDFSLQFKDDKLLTCYRFFKAWEEYERLKKKGIVAPPNTAYITNKILHDQIGIYKFVVGEDGKELIYYAYACGCYPKNVPRDSFTELKENPVYSIDWHAFKIYDMDPRILYNFNRVCGIDRAGSNYSSGLLNSSLASSAYKSLKGNNTSTNKIGRSSIGQLGNQSDMELMDVPFIYRTKDPMHPSGYSYQLLWYVDNDPYSKYRAKYTDSTGVTHKEGKAYVSPGTITTTLSNDSVG